MNKNMRNFWLDLALSIVFVSTAASGLLLQFWSPDFLVTAVPILNRYGLEAVHAGTGFLALLGVIIHIIWHWSWLKALRGKPVRNLQKPVRTNRIVNRLTWFAYLSTNVFGLLAWSLHAILPAETIKLFTHLHFASSVTCLVFLVIHLALHRKWIASAIQRYSPGLKMVGVKQ